MLLSVIIPTRNRAGRLADLLDSLAGQEPAPFDWEVIVVDNASTDSTADVAQEKSQALPLALRHVLEPQLGLHHGRHRGAKEARGEYLGYLDDDMILAPSWLQGVELLVRGEAEAVVGRILPKWEAELPDWLSLLWREHPQGTVLGQLSLLDLGESPKPVGPEYVFGCNCFMIKKTLFDLGGFHPDGMPLHLLRWRGDGETGMMKKFKGRGLRSYYDPRATAFHIVDAGRLTLEYFCQRAYNQGISDSFTKIRADQGLAPPVPGKSLPPDPAGGSLSRKNLWERFEELSLTDRARALVGRARLLLRGLGKEAAPATAPGPPPEILVRMAEAHRAGWQFHQDEARRDPDLLKYILQPTYLADL